MINNQDEITKYKQEDKIYIPTELKNQNYEYKLNGDYIIIITNNNCQTQMNSTYCDCIYYNKEENLTMTTVSCNRNNNNQSIPYSKITDDINYSKIIRMRYYQDKMILISVIIIALLIASFLTKERNSY